MSPPAWVKALKAGGAVFLSKHLASVSGGTRTWYGTDALGSLRLTMSDAGVALQGFNYDPWGTPQGAAPPTFGFTGELQDASSGLVHLRARWYQPKHGRFGSRDPFEGFNIQPYSLHPYQYGYANPVLHTDPSGECIPRTRVSWFGRTVGYIGEEHCRPVRGVTELNWRDSGQHFWDTFKGIGSPGAWFVDQFAGTKGWDCIWQDPSLGTKLGLSFTAVSVGGAGWKYVGQGVWRWLSGTSSVWQLDKFQRGVEIEQRLGQNLPRNFPVIDRFKNGIATSIKSVDLTAPTYQSIPRLTRTVTGYIDKVAAYRGQPTYWAGVRILPHQITGRALDLVVPAGSSTPAQDAALRALQRYATSVRVDLNIIPMR